MYKYTYWHTNTCICIRQIEKKIDSTGMKLLGYVAF
jgi:hypothetical protein